MNHSLLKSLVIFLMVTASCSKPEKSGKEDVKTVNSKQVVLTDQQLEAANLVLGRIEQRNISGTIKVNGTLDVPPQNLVTISAPMGGFVKATDLLQGMKVTQGQVLVTLEHTDYIQLQQDYLENKNQLDFLELEYQRQEDLAKENVNAARTLQQSRSNYFGTKAKVQGLSAKLKLINLDPSRLDQEGISSTIRLYAPISGFVTQVNVNIGSHVNPADEMFRIIDTHHLHAEAQVFEKDIPKLKIGQRVRITLSNSPIERLAKVYLIGKEITKERTVRVHCHLDQEDPTLIPGMYFSGIIETENQTVPALPENAVVSFEGKDYIFVVRAGVIHKYEMIEIKKGITENGFVEIVNTADFAVQTPIVIVGAYDLLSLLKNTGE